MIAKDTHGELSRDSKNRLIMRCYRLFDWKKRSSGVEAFLRKNEYKNLSIYHYTMEKEKIPFILDEIGKTNIIPEKVKGLLKKSPNLDMLLENTIDETVVLLEKFKKDVGKATLNHQFLPIARKLGVPVYRTSIEKNGHVPYTVHPDLVLKSALNAEITDAKFRTITRNKMRTLSQALYEGNYKAEEYFTFFGGTESFKKDLKQVFFNVISAVNDNAEYDSLLFSIGQEYDPQYSKVETMHDEKLKLLTKDMANVKKGFEGTETVSANVEVKYRQLGDILTSMNERKIENIVRYIFRKYTDEKLGEKGIKPVRAGMKVYTVPFIEIKQEKERIEQLSLNLIGAILEFEKGVIEKAPSLQKISETAEQLAKEKGGLARLDFEAVLKKGGKVEVHKGVPLTEVRNSALHAGVPQEKPEDKARGKGAIPFWKYEDMEDHPLLENYIYERKQYRKAIKSYYSGGK